MNYWKLIKNAGLFIKFFKSLAAVIKYASEQKKFSNGLMSAAISDLEDILESGAVDIPGVDENEVAKVIENIRKNLLGQ